MASPDMPRSCSALPVTPLLYSSFVHDGSCALLSLCSHCVLLLPLLLHCSHHASGTRLLAVNNMSGTQPLLSRLMVTFVVCCVHLLTHAQNCELFLFYLRTARALLPCCADLSFRLMMTPSTEQQSAGEWHTLLHTRSGTALFLHGRHRQLLLFRLHQPTSLSTPQLRHSHNRCASHFTSRST
jgi:hypothetical protein